MDKSINWELYRSFLGVYNEGSLSAAARACGGTQPTLGRHIAALEKALNVTLFIHAPQGLIPTAAADALQPFAASIASTVAALERAAAGQQEMSQGVVRVAASEIIALEVLPPMLALLRQNHPGLTVELVVSNQLQDLLQHEADIAVRMVEPEQNPLVMRSVGNVLLGMYATREYLKHHGVPQTLQDLDQHSLIGFDTANAFIRGVAKAYPLLSRESFAFRTNSDPAQLALIRAGAGIGFCQLGIAQRSPELIRLLPEQFCLSLPTWVTMHEDLRDNPLCRIVFDALVSGLLQYVEAAAA
ncbi:LysR family transcriptional regulator [Pantoea sp. Acro-805]|uniref:LysR family transcriptional regulator n=1 Tax=Candidatus Pantoea formicae TaxID=2608355 RepID=A0ABX0QTX9_9GAMM|nr:LysR family transcriptional regulator [Pantoea formicae]MDF7649405.1 LysR family transcriptional regulator [Erwiniaceae bacterium L1_54_3]NIE99338.1 LysR family transcriptional regulator [Pantoea formicae]